MLSCRLPTLMVRGSHVSLAHSSDTRIQNVLPIVDLPARREAPRPAEVDFAVCVKPLFGGSTTNDVYNMTEFIEVCLIVQIFHQ